MTNKYCNILLCFATIILLHSQANAIVIAVNPQTDISKKDSIFDDSNQLSKIITTQANGKRDILYYDHLGKPHKARNVKQNEIIFRGKDSCFLAYLKNNITTNYQDHINCKVFGELIFSKDKLFEVRFYITPVNETKKNYSKKEVLRIIKQSKKQWFIRNPNDTLILFPFVVYFP